MNAPTPRPGNEADRQRALLRYGVLDSPPDPALDELTGLIASTLGTALAGVALCDGERVWLASRHGAAPTELPREGSPEAHVVATGESLVLADARTDPRFAASPLFAAHGQAFYAGVPLRAADGFVLGTVFVADPAPRELPAPRLALLEALTRQALHLLELRRHVVLARHHRQLFEGSTSLLCLLDLDGHLLEANAAWRACLGYEPALLQELTLTGLTWPEDTSRTRAALAQLAAGGQLLDFEHRLVAADGSPRWLSWYATCEPKEGLIFAAATDVSARKLAESRAALANGLLAVVAEAQNRSSAGADAQAVLQGLLAQLLALTHSTFGFIGEVDDGGTLRLRAVSDVAWDEATRARLAAQAGALELPGADSLLGQVLARRAAVVANSAGSERLGLALPGLPLLRAFLGIPFFHGERLLGLVVLANRPGGYDEGLAQRLEPVLGTSATLIHAQREEERRRSSEQALAEHQQQLEALFQGAIDGLVLVDDTGRVERVNPAAERLFGAGRGQLEGLLAASLFAPAPKAVGPGGLPSTREAEGRRLDGSAFPAEVASSEVRVGGRRLVTAIVRDVSERTHVERLQSEFIATVSHELRTPLTAIRGALGLLAGAGSPLTGDEARLVEIALGNAERLGRLVNEILDLERLTRTHAPLKRVPLELSDVVKQALISNGEVARELEVGLALAADAPGVVVAGDADRLAQVLTNLLANACRFSPRGGAVEVSLARRGAVVRVSVRDHGAGVPEAFRARLFERFAQADPRARGGTGLGLSIARSIVEQLDGTIAYEPAPGGGSVFWFELPVLHVLDGAS